MEKLIQIRLREAGHNLAFRYISDPEKEAVERLKPGGCVIVEADRGWIMDMLFLKTLRLK